MNHCKDCDGPLTTYQGINQRPEDAEVFCAYCEANPPTHDDIVDHVTSQVWGEVDSHGYSDFGGGLLEHVLRNAPAPSGGVYLSLHTDHPDHPNMPWRGSAELTNGNGYARRPISFDPPNRGATKNESLVSFTATADWPTITHLGVYDAKTRGNLLFSSPLTVRRQLNDGGTLEFQPGTVEMQIT